MLKYLIRSGKYFNNRNINYFTCSVIKLFHFILTNSFLCFSRKPQEDSEISDQIDLPQLKRIAGCRLPGQAMADLLMVFEFLHNFGETLGFGKSFGTLKVCFVKTRLIIYKKILF